MHVLMKYQPSCFYSNKGDNFLTFLPQKVCDVIQLYIESIIFDNYFYTFASVIEYLYIAKKNL